MTYKILKDFNGATRRFKTGAEAGASDLADAPLSPAELIAAGLIRDDAAAPARQAPARKTAAGPAAKAKA
jgi:hypothetical protein